MAWTLGISALGVDTALGPATEVAAVVVHVDDLDLFTRVKSIHRGFFALEIVFSTEVAGTVIVFATASAALRFITQGRGTRIVQDKATAMAHINSLLFGTVLRSTEVEDWEVLKMARELRWSYGE